MQLSAGNYIDLGKIEPEIKDYVNSFPASASKCLAGNQEIASARTGYGIENDDSAAIEHKIKSYEIYHLSADMITARSINSAFTAGKFDNAGKQAGALLKKFFGVSFTFAIIN